MLFPEQMNVAIAIFVLPINAAINPFLYTLNVMFENIRKLKEEDILKSFLETPSIERDT